MQVCSNCGHQNPDNIPVCLKCAASLGKLCPSCGSNVPAGNKFCGQCGKIIENQETGTSKVDSLEVSFQAQMLNDLRSRMPSSLSQKIRSTAPEMHGQLREVTILFANIANFAVASQTLDSEVVFIIVDEIMQVLSDLVYKYEGTIDNFTGDGLMALFGIPLNHENDPERAVRAALEMLTQLIPTCERIKQKYNLELEIHIGINTGLVIAGNLGSQHHMEYMVIGDTVNFASHLAMEAQPGTILIGFQTYQRCHPIFFFETTSPIQIKGFPTPVKAYRPLSIRQNPGKLRGLPGLSGLYVGRQTPLKQLSDTVLIIQEQKPNQVVLISGEAGIGKTRLVTEFTNLMIIEGIKIIQGNCVSYMRASPYRVIADVVRSVINISETAPVDYQRDTLYSRLEELNLQQNDLFPYLLNILGLPQPDPYVEARLKLLDPSMLQHQTHSALRTFFLAETQTNKSVMIFDDLHWVDPASRDFLTYFSQSLDNYIILLILIARDFRSNPVTKTMVSDNLIQAGSMIEIHLEPLSESYGRLLVDQIIKETTRRSDSIKRNIVDRAKGNPYYIEELVRLLIDNDGLVRQNGAWRVTDQANKLLLEVPGTLQNIIMARFDRLSEDLKLLLQHAAILGQTFAYELIEAVIQENSESLDSGLESLIERSFLFEFQPGRYEFRHPLVLDTIYDTLLSRDSRRLHLRVAQTLETYAHWLPVERSEALAHHYVNSPSPTKAIPYLITSAERAAQRFANESVIQFLDQAITLMDGEPNTSIEQYHKAKVGLATALKFTGDLEKARQVLEGTVQVLSKNQEDQPFIDNEKTHILIESLRELADIRAREGNLDDAVELLQTGIDLLENDREEQTTQWRKLVDRLAWVHFRQGKLEDAFVLAQNAVSDINSSETDDLITLASLNNTLGGIFWMRSQLQDAIVHVEQSLEINKRLNFYWGMATAYTNLGVLQYSLGNWQEAVLNMEQADALRSDHGYTTERPDNLKNLGEILICIGDHTQAREKFETSKIISNQLGLNLSEAYAEFGLCRLSLVEEKIPEASFHLEVAKNLVQINEDEPDDRTIQILFLEAQIVAYSGNFEKASEMAQKANQIAQEGGFQGEITETQRILGIIYTESGEYALAEQWLERSVESARDQNDLYRQAQALFDLGQNYTAWRNFNPSIHALIQKKGEEVYTQAISLFKALGAKYYLHRAQKALNHFTSLLGTGPLNPNALDANIKSGINHTNYQLEIEDGANYPVVILAVHITPHKGADPESVFETIALVIPSLLEIANQNKGLLLRRQDGFVILFGVPVSQEEVEMLAVDTAIQLINFYQECCEHSHSPIIIKIGINAGSVIAGRVGGFTQYENIFTGEVIREAELMAKLASPVSIWVCGDIHDKTSSRFNYSSVSPEIAANLPGYKIYQLEWRG